MKNYSLLPFERARSYIAKMPAAVTGEGGHNRTFAVACRLVAFGLAPDQAWPILAEYNLRCLPPWDECDLQHKLDDAFRRVRPGIRLTSEALRFRSPNRPKSKNDPATATANFLRGFRCEEVDLWEASPVRPPDDWSLGALALLENLFHPGEQVNFVTAFHREGEKARPRGIGTTVERGTLIDCWRIRRPSSDAGGWLRMNPMDGKGVADENVAAFRFALVECDAVPRGLQLAFLARLPLPIATVLTSGGRSLHAWVRVDAENLGDYRQKVARMLDLLARFGVDTQNKNPSRMSRLPGVLRQIGGHAEDPRQRLLYLNPQPTQKAIL